MEVKGWIVSKATHEGTVLPEVASRHNSKTKLTDINSPILTDESIKILIGFRANLIILEPFEQIQGAIL